MSTHHYQSIHKVWRLWLQQFLRYFADKVKMPKVTKGHNSWSILLEFIQKLIRSSTHHYKFIKFQGSSSNSFLDDKVKIPKITKGHNSWSNFRIYSKVNQVFYSSLPVYSSSFKALASIVFEIFCWQDRIYIFQRAITQERGHNPMKKKKYVSAIFSWGIHVRNFKTVACTVLKLCYASKSVTNGRTGRRTTARTDGRTPQKQYAPPTSSKLWA